MAENLDDGEFWLPPQFLTEEDGVMDKRNWSNKEKNRVWGHDLDGCSKPLFPYGFGSLGFSSDLSSPVESLVGSSETESDEEEFMAELTRRVAHSTLEFDLEHSDHGTGKSKGMVVFGSPQSTLCAFGSGCGCKQGSSHGSPNSACHASSPGETWDLLHAAAGEVERMRLKEKASFGFNQNNTLLVSQKKPNPVIVPWKNTEPDFVFYSHQSLSHHQLQVAHFEHLRQQQIAKQQQQQNCVWGGGQSKPNPRNYQQRPTSEMVPKRGKNGEMVGVRNIHPIGGLSSSAWPPLQQNQQLGSGMRAFFLGNPSGKRECAGTGVFLPRRTDNPAETKGKPACSTVLVPARVAQALNLKLEDMGAQPQYQSRFNGSSKMENDGVLLSLGSNNNVRPPHRRNLRSQSSVNHEIRLPQEWTY